MLLSSSTNGHEWHIGPDLIMHVHPRPWLYDQAECCVADQDSRCYTGIITSCEKAEEDMAKHSRTSNPQKNLDGLCNQNSSR